MSAPRVVPVAPPFAPPVAEALARIMPPGVPPLALFRSLAVNERVFLRIVAGGLLDRGSIPLRDRELVIQRTCARLGCEYEWGVHAAFFAAKARLSAEDLAATRALPGSGASVHDRLLFALVDALVDTATVGDGLWPALAQEWTPEQLVELIALAGFYHLISFAANAFRIPPEPFAAKWSA
jgi:alkylhydroperoxidase family enzyme